MKTETFDCATTPLLPGVTLIDSSAGTGKTFAIATIVPRLLLEGIAQDITQILVVTFTNAAADELAARIRVRIQQALRAASGEVFPDDPFLRSLDGERARRIFSAALARMDELPVYTIHGFCKQALQEAAFESGLPLECEFLQNEEALIRQATLDYWRRTVYPDEILAALAARQTLTPELFHKEFEQFRRYPGCQLLPVAQPVSILLQRLHDLAGRLRKDWDEGARAAELAVLPALSQSKDNEAALALREPGRLLTELSAAAQGAADGDFLLALSVLSASQLTGALKSAKDRAAFQPSAYSCLIEEAVACRAELKHALRAEVFDSVTRSLQLQKQKLNQLSFSDLLQRLQEVLIDPQRGPALRRTLRDRFKSALIDEFQDTDPLQLDIFTRLFRGACPLFFIGDPKQAIYSFRGADIFAYLDAARTADRRHTLDKNWRSETGVVEAINRLFERKDAPFVFPDISFPPATAQGKEATQSLCDPERRACHWLQLPASGDGKLLSKDAATRASLAGVRTEVLRLLNGSALVAGRRLRPSDLSFLVRTNDQAQLLQRVLRGAGVPAVIGGSGSILHSPEFSAVELLLGFIARQEGTAALGGMLWGLNARQMRALAGDEGKQNEVYRLCGEYRRLWERQGAAVMLRRFLEDRQVIARLLAQSGGERSLTNLRHVLQILQEGPLAPESLLQWLQRRRQEPFSDRDELRLETDADAAQIVTIHKSKGLEYPVVFCPFLWDGKVPSGRNPVIAHLRGADGTRIVYDCGSQEFDRHLALAREESLSEDLRLLYVALTRAVHRIYISWGEVAAAPDGGLGWLLGADTPQTLCQRHPELFSAALQEETGGRYAAPLDVVPDGGQAASDRLARTFPADRRLRSWDTCSFSSLTAHCTGQDAAVFPSVPAEAAASLPVPEAAAGAAAVSLAVTAGARDREGRLAGEDFFGFARGRSAPPANETGNCLHALLEQCCRANAAGLSWRLEPERIAQTLADYGLLAPEAHLRMTDPVEAVLLLLERIFESPLPGSGIRLGDVRACMAEMPFTLPLLQARIPQALGEYFSTDPAYAALVAGMSPRTLSGFLTGIMDLVFQSGGKWFILDWKSNHLGERQEDYGAAGLAGSMRQHHYLLQYTLYSVALRRYLTQRQPGFQPAHDLGGIYYGFLRGIDGNGAGWHFANVDPERLSRLESQLFA